MAKSTAPTDEIITDADKAVLARDSLRAAETDRFRVFIEPEDAPNREERLADQEKRVEAAKAAVAKYAPKE